MGSPRRPEATWPSPLCRALRPRTGDCDTSWSVQISRPAPLLERGTQEAHHPSFEGLTQDPVATKPLKVSVAFEEPPKGHWQPAGNRRWAAFAGTVQGASQQQVRLHSLPPSSGKPNPGAVTGKRPYTGHSWAAPPRRRLCRVPLTPQQTEGGTASGQRTREKTGGSSASL